MRWPPPRRWTCSRRPRRRRAGTCPRARASASTNIDRELAKETARLAEARDAVAAATTDLEGRLTGLTAEEAENKRERGQEPRR